MNYEVVTFGCRLNVYESKLIENFLENIEINCPVPIIVFNSCSVTQEAERKLKQSIRKKRKDFPDCKIILTGCAAQINADLYDKMSEIDYIIGNDEKLRPQEYHRVLGGDKIIEKVKVNDIMSVKETAFHLLPDFGQQTRAFIQIQNGCNHRCTFCIIPYARGNSRSVQPKDIVSQIKILVQSRYHEIVLTGVDIGDYGKDLQDKLTLSDLIEQILQSVPSLPRLRISSIDIAEIDDKLIKLITSETRLMPYLHISLQSGDDLILKRMRRRHNRQQVIDFCKQIKRVRPEITFGADLITGFPTETEEMFANSMSIISELPIAFSHIFPYSIREGTPAARMPQVNKSIIRERAKKLHKHANDVLLSVLVKQIGTIKSAIVEKNGMLRSEEFFYIKSIGDLYINRVGCIVSVSIIAIDQQKCTLLCK